MNLKKKIIISLISFWGVGIILALVFASISVLQKGLILSIAQANPACTVPDSLIVTGTVTAPNINAKNIWMKIIQGNVPSGASYTFITDSSNQKIYRIEFHGRIEDTKDTRILIRLNGSAIGYRSWTCMEGDAAACEWDTTGFYVGRNGWNQSADFSFTYTIAGVSGYKRTGSGEASFLHTGGNLIGVGRANGSWNSTDNITSITIFSSTGAKFSGELIVFASF